jgi:hypothetical protein
MRGELVLSADGKGIEARLAAPSGKRTPLSWVNTQKSTVDDSSVTAETAYSSGAVSPATGKQPKGDYFASALTYPAVDGVRPVISMFEQGFTSGTVVVTGMTLAGSPITLAIIGGTGEYGGAAGSVSLARTRPTASRMSATFWR